MPPRRKIDRKLVNSRKLSTNKRLSDTPKIKTPPRTARNILSQNSEILSEISTANDSPVRLSSNDAQKTPTTRFINPSDILKVSWKVFRVSPMYNFSENRLKTYARKLKEELAAYNSKCGNVIFDCSFQFQKSLFDRSYDIVQVLFSANNLKYKGYFISSQENQSKEEFSNIRHFPVLLVNGGEKITKQVHNTLCKFFDCDIHPIRFSFKALSTLFSSLAHFYIDDVPDFTSEAVLLHYKIPGCPQTDSIKVALSLAATSTVFAAFLVKFGNNLSNEQMISGYYDKILKHLLNVYQVDLSHAELCKVIFPGFAISSEGWVKFASEEIINRTLPIIGKFTELQYILYT